MNISLLVLNYIIVRTVFLMFFGFFSYTVRTDPRDVARVESKTFICTEDKHESVPRAKEGVEGRLGKWKSVDDMNKELGERYPGCMKGRF